MLFHRGPDDRHQELVFMAMDARGMIDHFQRRKALFDTAEGNACKICRKRRQDIDPLVGCRQCACGCLM
jgi:hypothetical protein